MNPCKDHSHPALDEPVELDEFARELSRMVQKTEIRRYSMRFSLHMSRRHLVSPRSYAEVVIDDICCFVFAPQTLWLPEPHRLGLIAHEIGHVMDPDGTEKDADNAAGSLGWPIGYDRRWGGKGLQYLK